MSVQQYLAYGNRWEDSDVTNEDKATSVVDWGKIKTEILKLKCNQYGIISTGKKIDIQRLYEYFHADGNVELEVHTAGPSTEGSNTNSDILSELRLLRNEMNVIKVKQRNNK